MSEMFSSKFVKTIKTLNEKEFRSFGIWLASPRCNSNKTLIALFEKLKYYYPEFSGKGPSKASLFRKIAPGKKFSAHQMNKLLSGGYLQLERFLIFENLEKDQNLQKGLLTKELRDRNLEDFFFKTIGREIARIENKPVKDRADYLDLFQLNRRVYHHPNQSPRMPVGSSTILKMESNLDLAYLLEKAAIINEKIFRNRILRDENYDIEKDLRKWFAASEGVSHLSLEFYRRRFSYTDDNMLAEYFELRKLFFEKYGELSEEEQKVHLLSLINDSTFLRKLQMLELSELLPVYQLGLEIGALLENDVLDQVIFISIVIVSNASGEFEFTEDFVRNYLQFLDPDIQKDAGVWAKAHTANKSKRYENCLEILLDHEFKTYDFQKATRVLTLQTYFDLFLASDIYQFYLLSFCESFEKWIRRDRIKSSKANLPLLRLIQSCRALVKICIDPKISKAATIKKIEEIFRNGKNIHASGWLEEKRKEILALKVG